LGQARCIQIKKEDNVAVATRDIPAGTEVLPGLTTKQDIPQAHKITLRDISRGEAILRYGVVLGYARDFIPEGSLVSEHMLSLPEPPGLDSLTFGAQTAVNLPDPPVMSWEGYEVSGEAYGGTRNILGIHTTVQCVAGVLNAAVDKIRREILPRYPAVDGVVPVNHAYGCGVAIHAPEAIVPIRALQNLVKHPNFGGVIMAVGLGCEKLTADRLLPPDANNPENLILLQEQKGFGQMVAAICAMAERKLALLNQRKRSALPLSKLMVGFQCGGSDAFSGITANPAAGYASDMLVKGGATVLFSEVTEVRDGVHLLAQRCVSEEVGKKLIREMAWYDRYLQEGSVDRSANPTPGNKKGGLANIVEKAMGSIAKSGTAPIIDVLAPAERPRRAGLHFAATPASDFVCGPCQLASGIGIQVFMTGRGTPYGLASIPVVKVCSRNELKEQWPDLIDVNAGPVITGEASIADIGLLLFREIIETASGRKKSFAEAYGLYNDLCIFNPAPIT